MDVVVTVPKTFTHPSAPGQKGLAAWVAEGDPANSQWTGQYWVFSTFGMRPKIKAGERVYIVCEGKLRGYAPLVALNFSSRTGAGYIEFVRGGGAVAVTIDQAVQGFQGWRYRWWDYADERPFPNWMESESQEKGLFT